MAKLSAKMQAMHVRMVKAHRFKAHARDLAAYHEEMRAIQTDLIRAEIELQADLAAEGFHGDGHGHHHHHYQHQHHAKRPFTEETNHTDELNHVVHDEMCDAEHFHQHSDLHAPPGHLFEDLELPSLFQLCPSTYRHSANGVQKMELARSDSAQLREINHHGGHTGVRAESCPTQAHHAAIKHHELAHESVIHVATTGMMAPGTSNPTMPHPSPGGKTAVAMEMKPVVVTAVPGGANLQVQGSSGKPESKKRRTVKRNPTRPSHIPWTTAESEAFKKLVADEGPSKWEDKARKLGTGRTSKALHTRWMRDQGRIIDRPRVTSKKKAQTNVKPPPPPPTVPVPSTEAAPHSSLARAPAPAPAPLQQQTSTPAATMPEPHTDASVGETEWCAVATEAQAEPFLGA
jgi:hypothetical protein